MDFSEPARLCKVCGSPASGVYFGALVCLPCKSFYIRCTKDEHELRCQQDPAACTVNKGRFKCQACRFKACIKAGMHRKEEKPEVVNAPAGKSLCMVCGDLANGVHFGVISCEGCKKFFRRGLNEYQNYQCQQSGECPINPRTRNACRFCRYQACLKNGMSREAIKVGRPPNSKKENSRHHPYQHNVISESNQKLYTGNNYMKPDVPWKQTGNAETIGTLPALIHNNNTPYNQKGFDRQHSSDLNASCTSTDMNNLLMSYLGPNGDMAPLPSTFDLDEALAQIDDNQEPSVMKRPHKLQKLETRPHQAVPKPNNNDGPLAVNGAAFFPMKVEPTEYREVRTHPSPPYDPFPEQPFAGTQQSQMYTNKQSSPHREYRGMDSNVQFTVLANQNQSYNGTRSTGSPGSNFSNQGSPYSRVSNANSPQSVTSNQGSPYSHPNNQGSPYNPNQQTVGFPQHGQQVQQQRMHNGHSMTNGQYSGAPNGVTSQYPARPSCEHNIDYSHSAPSSYLSQAQFSHFNSSGSGSPHSNSLPASGYVIDSHDFLDEFSIYDPVDIRQVNHKYMPSCSFEPLVFNEEALTVDDFWSKNLKNSDEEINEATDQNEDSAKQNSGQRFKHMNSIDDKIDQNYWFKLSLPVANKYGADRKKQMDYLMLGWLKSKNYYMADAELKSPTDKEPKMSHWPNVKENAPLQLKMWEFIKTRLLRGTTAQVMFFQHLSGSGKVQEGDQKTLVSTSSFSNCLLMNILYWWDEERDQCKYFWSWKIPASDPFHVFRLTLLKFSRAIRDLNFDEKEIMLTCALMLFSSDILQVKGKNVIEKERKPVVDLAAAYMKDKYKEKWEERFRIMMSMVPALRYLSIWHHDMMAFAKTFGSNNNSRHSSTSSANGLSLEKMKISET